MSENEKMIFMILGFVIVGAFLLKRKAVAAPGTPSGNFGAGVDDYTWNPVIGRFQYTAPDGKVTYL